MIGASLRRIALPILAVVILVILVSVVAVWVRSDATLEDANGLLKLGAYSKAEILARAVVAAEERDGRPESPEVARALDSLVMALWQQGKEMEAETLEAAERTVRIKKENAHVETKGLARSLNNLASLLLRRGRYEDAKELFEEVLSIRESTYGDDEHIKLATPLTNLGRVLFEMGDHDQARARYEKALKIRMKHESGELRIAAVRNPLGIVLHELGDLRAAERELTAALDVRRKLLPADHIELAKSCLNFARLLKDMGETGRAEELLKESLGIWETARGDEHSGTAVSLHYLGELYCDLGRYTEAKPLLERAARIRENMLGHDNAFFALTLSQYAQVLARVGESSSARDHFDRALGIFTAALGSDYFLVGQLRSARGKFHFDGGRFGEALTDALRAERIGRDHVLAIGDSLAEREILRYDAVRASGLDLAVSVVTVDAPGSGVPLNSLRDVWDAVTRSRALVLDEMIGRHRSLARATDPEIAALVRTLEEQRRRLAHLRLRRLSGDSTENSTYRRLLDEARAAKEEMERDLAGRSKEFRRTLKRNHAGLDDVVKALPEHGALVAFVRYNSYDAPFADRSRQETIDRGSDTIDGTVAAFVAFVIKSSGDDPEIISLGPAQDIESLVARWRLEVAKGATTSDADSRAAEVATNEIGAELRRKIWDPLASRIEAAGIVFIVPDGVLHLVNFAALPDGDGYLVDRELLIHYLSAERDLLLPAVPLGVPPGSGRGLLAVGAPDFDASAGSGRSETAKQGTRPFHFEPLPGTAREVVEIAALWKKGTQRDDVVVLTGADARERALKEQGPGHEVLHLATHGFFYGDGQSAALGQSGARGTTRGIASWTLRRKKKNLVSTREAPLTLAGLALAGANHLGVGDLEAGGEDGILTAEEITSMDLAGVRWAILSACDSGVGTTLAGEGVLGLRRAFQIAGVRTLVMSLWSVDDEATRRWMGALYRKRFVENLQTADAARGASREFLREQRERRASTHPFFWAGFVAVGDWR